MEKGNRNTKGEKEQEGRTDEIEELNFRMLQSATDLISVSKINKNIAVMWFFHSTTFWRMNVSVISAR